jgi:hypothetical protein
VKSEEDTSHFGIGTPDPVSIFLDLRPASELMNPIFLPYNDKDEWGKFAPWVWTEVRANFEGWLTQQGLNQPIDEDLVEDYRPRTFTITFPAVTIDSGKPVGVDGYEIIDEQRQRTPISDFYVNGSITISQLKGVATPGGLDPGQSLLVAAGGAALNRATVTGAMPDPTVLIPSHQVSVGNTLASAIATTAGNVKAGAKGGLCFSLAWDLDMYVDVWLGGETHRWQPVHQAHFQSDGMVVELPFENLLKGQTQAPTKTIDVDQTTPGSDPWKLHFSIAVTDAGPFEN